MNLFFLGEHIGRRDGLVVVLEQFGWILMADCLSKCIWRSGYGDNRSMTLFHTYPLDSTQFNDWEENAVNFILPWQGWYVLGNSLGQVRNEGSWRSHFASWTKVPNVAIRIQISSLEIWGSLWLLLGWHQWYLKNDPPPPRKVHMQ